MTRCSPLTLISFGVFAAIQAVFITLRFSWKGVAYYRLVRVQTYFFIECVMLLFSLYIWKRLSSAVRVFDPTTVTPARLRWRSICLQDVAKAVILMFLVLAHISFTFYFVLIGTNPHIMAIICLTALALYLHVVIFLLLSDLVYFISKGFLKCGLFVSTNEQVKKWSQNSPFRHITSSRDHYSLLAAFCAVLFILGGLYSTFRDPVYRKVTIPMRKFESDTSPLNIALLSDIHMGPTVGRKRMERIVELTNKLNPDVIAISGDLADGFVKDLHNAAEPLCNLKSKYGVYFATGNHEYMHGNIDEWFAFLKNCNITVLHNEFNRFKYEKNEVCMAGTDDLYAARSHFIGHGMDSKKALSGCEPTDAVILLAHQPNAAGIVLNDILVSNKVDLILSGHTHGGQMYLFVPIIYIANAFARGLYQHPATGAYVYVSAGVNFFGPPIKMFGACEIIDISLVPTRV